MDDTANSPQNNQQLTLLLTFAVIFLLIGIIIVYYFASETGNTPDPVKSRPTNTISQVQDTTPTPAVLAPIEVEFDYTVESIGESEIVLNGDQGLFRLSIDQIYVTVMEKDIAGEFQTADISTLQLGQIVNLTFVPGQSAIIYIQ